MKAMKASLPHMKASLPHHVEVGHQDVKQHHEHAGQAGAEQLGGQQAQQLLQKRKWADNAESEM